MDTADLYQALIIDHSRSKKYRGCCESITHAKEGHNPLCGDHLKLTAQVVDGKIVKVRFEGHGCAISMASASLMCEAMEGLSLTDAQALFQKMHRLLTADEQAADLGKLSALENVKSFPMRVKCATLAWHTLHAAVTHDENEVSTE